MPELLPENVAYWAAYLDLQRIGVQRSYHEINAYAELSGLHKTELLVKLHAIEDALNEDRRVNNENKG